MGAFLTAWGKANIDLILWLCSGLAVALFALLGYIGRDIYQRVHGKGLVTTDHCEQCGRLRAEREDQRDQEHKIFEARLAAGDQIFKEIHQGQRVIALVLFQLCRALNENLALSLDCEQLSQHITGRSAQ